MQEIITSFVYKHGINRAEVMTEIEAVFPAMLSRWYHLPVMVFFRKDRQLEAVAYDDSGGLIMQKPIELAKMNGRKTILRYLGNTLAQVAVLKQTNHYKFYEKELLWGEITSRDAEQNLYVEVEVIPGEKVTAICPLNRIGLHERHSGNFSIGQNREILPVKDDGKEEQAQKPLDPYRYRRSS